MNLHHLYLAIAIVAEVIATSALKASEGFTRLWPSVFVAVGYSIAFYFLSLALRTMAVGIAYAIWCGVGIVLVAVIGWIVLGQKLDIPAIVGMGLIIAGVAVINLFSQSTGHGPRVPAASMKNGECSDGGDTVATGLFVV